MSPYFPEHRALTLDERIAQHPEIACAAAGCRIVSATAWDDGLDCVRLYHFADNDGANSSTLIGNEDIENTDVDLVEEYVIPWLRSAHPDQAWLELKPLLEAGLQEVA